MNAKLYTTVCMALVIVSLIPLITLPLVSKSEKSAPLTLLSLISATVNWKQLLYLYYVPLSLHTSQCVYNVKNTDKNHHTTKNASFASSSKCVCAFFYFPNYDRSWQMIASFSCRLSLPRSSELQATESWVGPGNEARQKMILC